MSERGTGGGGAARDPRAPEVGARTVYRRAWMPPEGWRDTRAGMWAWLIQRAAAILLLVVIALHLANPFVRPVQAALLALVLLHALLGVRAIALDFGVPLRWHRALFVAALGLAVLLFVVVWRWS